MTELTVKRIEGIPKSFYIIYPAFYDFNSDTVVLTKRIFERKFYNNICDIINHEYLHATINKIEGFRISMRLDNIHELMGLEELCR